MVLARSGRLRLGGIALIALGVLLGLLVLGGSPAAQAETGKKALILSSSVSGGASSLEAQRATANGFTVTLVDDPTWAAMTAAQFADYQMIVVGDPNCASLPEVVSQNATALSDAVMARAGGNPRVGNRILIGTDPVFHRSQGGDKLTETGIDFAGAVEGASGLYLTFTCGDPDYDDNDVPDGEDLLLPKLTIDPDPNWSQNSDPPCGGSASLISNAAQFSTLTSGDLQGWGCSVHETFPTFPTDWTALALATDTPTSPTCGTDVDSGDPECGEAHVLIAGSSIVAESPDLKLDPPTAVNPVGTTHTVTATVTNPDDSPRSGVEVSFLVTGANAGAVGTCVPADCRSNAEGKVTFTYTGANAGEDTINASMTIDGSRQTATASKTWEEGGGGEDPEAGKVVGRSVTYFGGTNNYNNNVGLRVLMSGVGDTNKAKESFALPCVLTDDGFDLEVKWGFRANATANRFVATNLTEADCIDNPLALEGSPVAGFDTHKGTAEGTYNGGPATATWTVVDKGETPGSAFGLPGARRDRLQVTITDAGGVVLSIGNRFIGDGNHDALPAPPVLTPDA